MPLSIAGLKAVPESIKDPLRYFDFNVMGTINLLKVWKNLIVRR